MFQRFKKLIVSLLLGSSLLYAAPSQAGLVWFSRANCVNNESITWDWPGTSYWLWVDSWHYWFRSSTWEPNNRSGWVQSYRAAVVHWGEGFTGGAYVVGDHWQFVPYYGTYYLGRTQTDNCNLGFFFPYW